MNNTIYNDYNDDTIGFYGDIVDGYKKLIADDIMGENYDNAKDLIDQLGEVRATIGKGYRGLLLLSNNNGMGFTCEPLVDGNKLAIGVLSLLEESGIELNSQVRLVLIEYIKQHLTDRGVYDNGQ